MKVLSLFDGISCGRVALDRAGIPVERYTAYEICESAKKISRHNWPDIEQKGDVFKADFTQYSDYDLLIGGSPCTYWSICQKPGRRETTNEGLGWDLFSQYVRALRESGIRYFLYENNYSMSPMIKREITKTFGIEPIMINSELVSAQSRKRYYWTNIPCLCQPDDMGITLQSVLEHGKVDREKAHCIVRRYGGFRGSQSMLCRRYFGKKYGQAVFEGDIEEIRNRWMEDPYFKSDEVNIRQMTLIETERCQTLPDGYTADVPGVSVNDKYEGIGNGWTVNVIAHILRGFERERNGEGIKRVVIRENELY